MRRPIPGLDGTATTDLAVLAPPRPRPPWQAPRLRARHGVMLVLALVVCTGVAEAQVTDRDPGIVATLWRWMPFLLKGFGLNLVISFGAMAIGTIAGVALGLAQVSLLAPVRAGSWLLTQFFRNSPWLVLLFAIMLLFPFEVTIGTVTIPIPDWVKATFGFSLPIMANISEVVRGAVQSIPSGQWESAESLAFTRRQTMTMVILPQCIKRMIPPWMNWYAILTMATPLASILGVEEAVNLTQQALVAEDSRTELLAPFYLFLLIIFFAYCYPIARWTIALERRYAVRA